jgi:hypothetical protein
MKFFHVLMIFLMVAGTILAEGKKSVEALRISEPLVIDGFLDEPVYQLANPAVDFVQLQPHNGQAAMESTEAWFFFDHEAIYVGVMLHDSAPDSIFNFMSERDQIGGSDYFGVYFDPYNQGQLAYGFFITPAGIQIDIKAVKSDFDTEDGNWNAVWESKTRIMEKGWIVEMRIPYSAIRFSENSDSAWGLNMFRNIRRHSSNNSWNLVDRTVSGFIHQQGELTGISDIHPPVRLSFSPYSAVYYETKKNGGSDFIYRGGMDVKYGISDGFTLDMMLVPDFGQVQSDDKELNLSPYELHYGENRQFFNEGTELFQRGDIFYSRRIGAAPKFSAEDELRDHERVSSNPSETRLVNATKLSGRTNNGWGLGFLNAMSMPSYADVRDSLTGSTRRVLVQPFTNYNVSVVDKSLKNNSYISLINSNVGMTNNPFRANVTATEFQLRDKSKTYALSGKGGVSQRGAGDTETGYFGELGVHKNRGQLEAGATLQLMTDTYNPNDLGYLRRNNLVETESYLNWQVVEPIGIFREYNATLWWENNRVYDPAVLSYNEVGINTNFTFKNNYHAHISGSYATDKFDYDEPRIKGRFLKFDAVYSFDLHMGTDSRKNLSAFGHYGHGWQPSTGAYAYWGDLEMRWRVGQRFQTNYELNFNNTIDITGFVEAVNDDRDIYFALRTVKTLNNVWSASYVLNNKTSIKLRVYHHWTGSKNNSYYLLQKDGSLLPEPGYSENKDQNYNAFNIDMVVRWIFAPGSELSMAWKNAAYAEDNAVERDYWRNLSDTWRNQSNSLSVRVLYYIDYNSLKKKKA